MNLLQYADLVAYWRRYPPTHLLINAALGFRSEARSAADLGSLLAEAGPGKLFAAGKPNPAKGAHHGR